MTHEEFVDLVAAMRVAQKSYYQRRNERKPDNQEVLRCLRLACELERKVDTAVQSLATDVLTEHDA